MKKIITMIGLYSMTLTAMAQANEPGSGNCLNFDGSSSVRVLHDAQFDMSAGDLSLEAWVKTTSTSHGRIIAKGGISGTPLYQIVNHLDGRVGFQIRDNNSNSSTVFSTTTVNDGKWHHVAGVRSGNTINIYIDGVLSNSLSTTVGNTNNTLDLYIGQWGNNNLYFQGDIDEVRVWSVAKNATEVRTTMCSKLIGNETGLIGYWRMDEGGNGTCGGGEDVCDATGNGHEGTLQ